jgi:flagellar biogenesis protein FliO
VFPTASSGIFVNTALPWLFSSLVLGLLLTVAAVHAEEPTNQPLPFSAEPVEAEAVRPVDAPWLSWIIVLGVLGGGVVALRYWKPRGLGSVNSEAVDIVGRLPLTTRQQLHVVRFGRRVLLVAASETSAVTLGELTDREEVDELLAACRHGHADAIRLPNRSEAEHA